MAPLTRYHVPPSAVRNTCSAEASISNGENTLLAVRMSVIIIPTETSRDALNPKTVPPGYVTDKVALTQRKKSPSVANTRSGSLCLSLRFFLGGRGGNSPHWARASSFTRYLEHTRRRTTVGRIPLDEWLARRKDLCLTTHNAHNRPTSMPPVGFEPTISAGERTQTYALDSAATGTGLSRLISGFMEPES